MRFASLAAGLMVVESEELLVICSLARQAGMTIAQSEFRTLGLTAGTARGDPPAWLWRFGGNTKVGSSAENG